MRYLIVFVILTSIDFGICNAQSHIPIFANSFYYDNIIGYVSQKRSIDDGTIYILNELTGESYQFQITEGTIASPAISMGENVKVLLNYNGRYYHTNSFRMDSLVAQAPCWIFQIEEGFFSKKMFDSYYFALSIPPFECGAIKFKNRFQYHMKGKRMVKALRNVPNCHVSKNVDPICINP